MLPYFAPLLSDLWGPFRLLGSYLVLIGLGAGCSVVLTWYLLPKLWHVLPGDKGRAFTPSPEVAKDKPTGGGFLFVLLCLPVLLLVLPPSAMLWEVIGCLVLAMLTGYLDDRSAKPWGEVLKGSLDLVVAFLAALALCQLEPVTIWLPLVKGDFQLGPAWFVPLATVILWVCINATNCSDGVDGLAGSLTLLSLFNLGGFLYVVIGHSEFAEYLLVPHNPEGARWAVLLFTAAGSLAGYLWHNAEPSQILMGDAGSRFLGLLVGVAVLASGNPFLVVVMAPVVLANGGTGLVKVGLLRLFRKAGFDVTPLKGERPANFDSSALHVRGSHHIVQFLHRVRFPLHDHCRKNLEWQNSQVLLRFVLVQAFLTPLLLGLLVKLR